MVFLGRPYHFKVFKSCLPQILIDPFLNTLTHLINLLTFSIRGKTLVTLYFKLAISEKWVLFGSF